jgi:hypothetical protein
MGLQVEGSRFADYAGDVWGSRIIGVRFRDETEESKRRGRKEERDGGRFG